MKKIMTMIKQQQSSNNYHQSVMVDEVLEGLKIHPEGTYVDATFGGGGHTRAILKQLGEGELYAFDQDESARANVPDDPRVTFIHHNFRFLTRFLRYYDAIPVEGVLADLGVASFQIDEPGKGFSTRFEGPLDMRMDKDLEVTAADIVNRYEKEGLVKIFSDYGEVRNSKSLAQVICKERQNESIRMVEQFKEVIKPVTPAKYQNRYWAQVFQALRIEVNDELNNLKTFLRQSAEVLAPGGRLSVISYHSLEDRLVKRFTRKGDFKEEEQVMSPKRTTPVAPPLQPVNKKPITPSKQEVENNSRASSAKLRVAQKIKTNGK